MLGNLVNSRKKLKSQTLEPEKHEHRILTIKKGRDFFEDHKVCDGQVIDEYGGSSIMKYSMLLLLAFGFSSLIQAQNAAPSIKGIVISREQSMDVISLEMSTKNRAYLLYKNGTIFDGVPRVPPADFDVVASKRLEPKRWGTWTIQGNVLIVKFSSQKNLKDWFQTEPGKKGTRLDGYYWTVSAVSSGSGNVANASAFKGIAFSLDGRFQTNLSGGASFESDQGGLTAGSSSQDAGTYQIDGYALELRFMDKHLERLSFFRSSTKNDTLGIGGRYFVYKK